MFLNHELFRLELRNHSLRSYKREIEAHRECEEIALDPFSYEEIRVYLNAYFSPNVFPSDLAIVIHRKTEGHPLFARASCSSSPNVAIWQRSIIAGL